MDSVKHQLRKLTSILFAVLLITGTSAVGVMLVMPGVFAQTSDSSTDPTVSLEHDSIEIGQTVTWTQTVELATPDAVAIEVPADAEITDVQTSSGETVDLGSVTTTDVAPADTTVVAIPDPEMVQEGGDTTLAVIDESADGYNISFETPAPYTVEQDTSTEDLYQKEVTVAHDSALHYTDVKSYSDIPEDLVSQGVEFKLFWMVDGVKTDVTSNPQYAVSFVDTNGNGIVDQMQWTVPQLSEQQFVIEGIILAIDAEHLDSSRNVIENVYDQIKERDGIWTNPIPAGDYIRVTFERNLNNTNDITIVARSDSPDSSIEVYEKDGITAIANFGAVSEEGMYKIYLTNLIGDQKTFDLKVIGNPVEFDYITDPAATGGTSTSTVVAGIASADLEKTIGAGTNQLLLVGVSIKDSTDSVSGITWRSTCGTVAGSQSLVSSGAAASANGVRSEIWELVAPTQRVSGHVCVTFSGSVTKAVVGATDFTGVDQANPTPNANTATGTTDGSTTASQSVTSSSGNLVFGHTATDNNDNIGEGASQTNQWETADAVSNNKILGAASTKSSSAGSSTISHTSINQNSVHWAFSIVEVKSAPVVVGADLSISKSDSPDPVAEGGTITYTIGVSNAGPDTATSLTVTDNLPLGVSFVSATGTGWSCGQAAGVVTCTRASLAVGAAPDITITVTAPSHGASLTNNVSISSSTTDPTPGNNSASATTTVAGQADVGITKDVDEPGPINTGSTIIYTITVTNSDADDDATNVQVDDLLPSDVTYVSDDSGGDYDDVTGIWTVGTLASGGGSATINITVTINDIPSGTVTNTASVTSDNDQNSANDTDNAETIVIGQADVEVTKSGDVDPVLAGNNLVYTVSVTNNDLDDAATNVVVTDVLPSEVTYVSPANPDICTEDPAGTLTCDFGSVAPGDTESVDITVTVPVDTPTGTITNDADVTSDNDQNDQNDSASETTDVIGEADVEVTKSGPSYANIGDNLIYTVSVTNHDDVDEATTVVVTDTLPAGVTYVSPANPDICTEDPAGTLTCDFGSVAPGDTESVDITVSVNSNTPPGTITNNVSVTSDNDQNDQNDSDSTSTSLLPKILITNGAAYPGFDRSSETGRQFNNILTHIDQTNYKDTATNPGQFFLYLFYVGDPDTAIGAGDLNAVIPFPFITTGSEPIKVYSDASIVNGAVVFSGETPFTASGTATVTPSGALGLALTDYIPQNFGVTKSIAITSPGTSTGLHMVRIHLDWGLKGTSPYIPDINTYDALPVSPNTLTIENLDDFTFALAGDISGSETIQNKNIFKNDPGFAGLVLSSADNSPLSGKTVEFWTTGTGAKKIGTALTDENGYYSYYYKYTGKAATFDVKLPQYGVTKSVTLKSNQFAVLIFSVP